MPDKFGFWADVWNWINANTPVISGAVLAFIVAVARSRKEGEGLKSSLLEATLCGILSLGIISAFEYFGLPPNLATLFGVIIGFLGTKKLAGIVDSFIGRKFGGGNGN
ncbi:phage holin, lambda family [Budvicia aquatica]|nr:phage holin, lambda family [Budvicia aquatica]